MEAIQIPLHSIGKPHLHDTSNITHIQGDFSLLLLSQTYQATDKFVIAESYQNKWPKLRLFGLWQEILTLYPSNKHINNHYITQDSLSFRVGSLAVYQGGEK
jgi:hypothetical protein